MVTIKKTSNLKNNLKQIAIYSVPFVISIIYWELILFLLINGTGIQLPWSLLFFLPAQCLVLTLLVGWTAKQMVNRLVSLLEMAFLCFFYCADMIYFRIFGSLFSLSMMGVGGDAVTNFGWALWSTVKTSFGWVLLFILPVIIYALWLFLVKPQQGKLRVWEHAVILAIVVVLWLGGVLCLQAGKDDPQSAYEAYHSSYIDTDSSAARIGTLTNTLVELKSMIFGSSNVEDEGLIVDEPEYVIEDNEEVVEEAAPVDTSPQTIASIDFSMLAEMTDNSAIKELCEYFDTQTGSNKNEYTGMFEGYNLIYICAESFSQWAIDPEITPTLYKLSQGGIVLNNYYNSFKNTTTNGEFAMLTGLWPDVSRDASMGSYSGSMSESSRRYMPMGLGTLFTEQLGATAYGYHNYLGSYYNRKNSLTNLGFITKFMNEGMTFTTSWPSSDLEMMEQSIDDYINDDQFVAYYITFSGHGPYNSDNVIYNKNIKEVKELAKDRDLTSTALGYYACNLELEKAMTYLLERLEEAGKLDNTLIVLTGDHYPYYLSTSSLNSIAGYTVDTNFEYYKSTCIMWTGSLEEPIVSDTYCCNIDILPTVLNLLGIEYESRLLSGTDIFSSGIHMAVLYNKSFINERMMYNASNGKVVWMDEAYALDSDATKQYTKYISRLISSNYSASLKIITKNFYQFVWENSGLIAEETVPSD